MNAKERVGSEDFEYLSRVVFWFYIVLLVPWLLFLIASPLHFERHFEEYIWLICVWSYPLSLFVAFHLRYKSQAWLFLPCINVGLPLLIWGAELGIEHWETALL